MTFAGGSPSQLWKNTALLRSAGAQTLNTEKTPPNPYSVLLAVPYLHGVPMIERYDGQSPGSRFGSQPRAPASDRCSRGTMPHSRDACLLTRKHLCKDSTGTSSQVTSGCTGFLGLKGCVCVCVSLSSCLGGLLATKPDHH